MLLLRPGGGLGGEVVALQHSQGVSSLLWSLDRRLSLQQIERWGSAPSFSGTRIRDERVISGLETTAFHDD